MPEISGHKIAPSPTRPAQVQIWVPDVTSPQFAAEAHRQSALLAESPTAAEDQAFVDDLSDWPEE